MWNISRSCNVLQNYGKECVSGGSNKVKTKLARILEADESTRMRMGNSIPHHHEDHIAGKGEISLQHYNLVHKFIPMLQKLWKFLQRKQRWTRKEKIEENFGVELDKSKKERKKEVIDEARTKGAKVHFASLMDICHLKMLNWRQNTRNTKVEL